MVYNLTNIMASNESGMLTFVTDVNHVLMGDQLGNIFLIGFSIILFTSFYLSTSDVAKAGMGAFMIGFVLSIAFVALGLAHTLTTFIMGTLLVLSVIFSKT